jgi:hypothetical protein
LLFCVFGLRGKGRHLRVDRGGGGTGRQCCEVLERIAGDSEAGTREMGCGESATRTTGLLKCSNLRRGCWLSPSSGWPAPRTDPAGDESIDRRSEEARVRFIAVFNPRGALEGAGGDYAVRSSGAIGD